MTALGDTDRFLLDVGVTIRTADLSACTSEMAELALLYDGTIEVVGTRQTFNGTGAFGYTRVGWAEVSTADEVLDDTVCATEALNGTTRVVSGGDEVVLTYDGAVACSPYGVVPWSLNGVDQGELTGLRCAIGAGPASAWLLFPALLLLRRRGSRERRRA